MIKTILMVVTLLIVGVMQDPRLAAMFNPKTMPFDGKRMFWGGFKMLVDM